MSLSRDKLLQMGFADEQIEKMIRIFDKLLKLSPERLRESFDNLVGTGFSENEARRIYIDTPSVFGMAILKVKEKIEALRNVFGADTNALILNRPKVLIQSVAKTNNRHKILAAQNVSPSVMERALFLAEKQFLAKYGR